MQSYNEKLKLIEQTPLFMHLSEERRSFLKDKFLKYRMTFQEARKLIEMSIDFQMWDNENILLELWPMKVSENSKLEKQKIIRTIEKKWNELKESATDYSQAEKFKSDFSLGNYKFLPSKKEAEDTILGKCPVASPKTLCCNLQTLDAVDNCSFGCSYCSIQSFYPEGEVYFEENLMSKLNRVEIDPDKKYHIGTGQSSDSLLVGNRGGILDDLMAFARKNPNIALELKTKSKNIHYLLQNDIPKNVICTWSINTQTIIDAEEHNTASLEERLQAAKHMSEKGNLVGFHFHPMIHYNEHKKEYALIAKKIQEMFTFEQIALISIGTLTFTKPVMVELRKKRVLSKVLQIPMVDAAGKFSYPIETKIELFKNLYDSFAPWHNKLFFYFCMEDRKCWQEVFKYEYRDNNEFEKAMLSSYFSKIEKLKSIENHL